MESCLLHKNNTPSFTCGQVASGQSSKPTGCHGWDLAVQSQRRCFHLYFLFRSTVNVVFMYPDCSYSSLGRMHEILQLLCILFAELDWKEATCNGTIREMIVPTYVPIIPDEPKFSSTARTSSHMGVNWTAACTSWSAEVWNLTQVCVSERRH